MSSVSKTRPLPGRFRHGDMISYTPGQTSTYERWYPCSHHV